MADKKIIAVTGATGSQGGGLVRAILADPNGGFAARAITRDTNKDKAKALAAAGAEVVSADLDNVDSLKKAFAGAHAVFAVTNFWEHFSGDKEIQQAKNIAEAAKAAGVKHVVWSTLEDTRKLMSPDDTRMPILQGRFRVPHFDAKSEADAAFAGLPTTYLLVSFYWDNLYMFGLAPKKDDTGVHSWAFPMGTAKLAGIDKDDIGRAAYGIFKGGSQYIGKRIGIAGEHVSFDEMSQKLRRVSESARSSTPRSTPICSGASASPAPTNTATCSRSIATSKKRLTRSAASNRRARSLVDRRIPSTSGSRRTRQRSSQRRTLHPLRRSSFDHHHKAGLQNKTRPTMQT